MREPETKTVRQVHWFLVDSFNRKVCKMFQLCLETGDGMNKMVEDFSQAVQDYNEAYLALSQHLRVYHEKWRAQSDTYYQWVSQSWGILLDCEDNISVFISELWETVWEMSKTLRTMTQWQNVRFMVLQGELPEPGCVLQVPGDTGNHGTTSICFPVTPQWSA